MFLVTWHSIEWGLMFVCIGICYTMYWQDKVSWNWQTFLYEDWRQYDKIKFIKSLYMLARAGPLIISPRLLFLFHILLLTNLDHDSHHIWYAYPCFYPNQWAIKSYWPSSQDEGEKSNARCIYGFNHCGLVKNEISLNSLPSFPVQEQQGEVDESNVKLLQHVLSA